MPPATGSKRTAYRTCPLCEATCGVALEIEGDRILRVRGDKDDPFSGGFICPKGESSTPMLPLLLASPPLVSTLSLPLLLLTLFLLLRLGPAAAPCCC